MSIRCKIKTWTDIRNAFAQQCTAARVCFKKRENLAEVLLFAACSRGAAGQSETFPSSRRAPEIHIGQGAVCSPQSRQYNCKASQQPFPLKMVASRRVERLHTNILHIVQLESACS